MKKVFLVLFTLLLFLPLTNVLAATPEKNTVIGGNDDSLTDNKIDDDDSSKTEPEKTETVNPVAEELAPEENTVEESAPSTMMSLIPIDPDDVVPPDDVTFILGKSIFEKDKPYLLELNFDYPIDLDFSHFRIYRNGQLLEGHYKLFTFIDSNVLPNTTYIYKIISVDENNNHSHGFIESIKTDFIDDIEAPDEPIGLSLSAGNSTGRIIWSRNTETDLEGYNVYLNGVLHGSTQTNTYMITSLNNSSLYTVTVTAVDLVGNESLHSTNILLSPKEKAMPVLKSNYNSQQVADGINSTFSKFFPLIAFVAGVPLAYYLGMRIKTLILV